MEASLLLHGRPAFPAAIPLVTDLSVRGVSKRYNGTTVLDDVGFEVRRGEAVSLIGSNGSGKSTLLRCCLRLIEPDFGNVSLFGQDVMGLRGGTLRRMRAQVGFVFQRHNLVPRLSVLTNVLHGAQSRDWGPHVWYQGLAPSGLREEALSCLERVGLAHLAQRRVDGLSGGQSQRVAIARALMQRPRIIFADEPVASLDPAAGEEVMQLFTDLIRAEGITLVFASHNLDHATGFADRLLGLQHGRVELDLPARSVRAQDLRGFYG